MTTFCSGVKILFPPLVLGAAAAAVTLVLAATTEATISAVVSRAKEVTAVPAATRVVGNPVGRTKLVAVGAARSAVLTAVRMRSGIDIDVLLV